MPKPNFCGLCICGQWSRDYPRSGPGTELVKMNLKDAYRVIPVHPQDLHLLGTQWCGDTFVDWSLPFGLRSATKIFTAFSDMVVWAIHYRGVRHLLHYLDDFLLFGQPGTLEAGAGGHCMGGLCRGWYPFCSA